MRRCVFKVKAGGREARHGQEDVARHNTIVGIVVKTKCGIRKLHEARRGSATVHGLAEYRKQHTAHIKEQHKERCGWHVEVWQRVSLVLAAWCTGGVARRARWRLRWRYDTAQGGVQWERVRESDAVIGLMHEWKESGKRDDGRA